MLCPHRTVKMQSSVSHSLPTLAVGTGWGGRDKRVQEWSERRKSTDKRRTKGIVKGKEYACKETCFFLLQTFEKFCFKAFAFLSHHRFSLILMFPIDHCPFLWASFSTSHPPTHSPRRHTQRHTRNFLRWVYKAGKHQVNFHGSGTLALPWQLLPLMPHIILPHWRRRKRVNGLLPRCLAAPSHCHGRRERKRKWGGKWGRGQTKTR